MFRKLSPHVGIREIFLDFSLEEANTKKLTLRSSDNHIWESIVDDMKGAPIKDTCRIELITLHFWLTKVNSRWSSDYYCPGHNRKVVRETDQTNDEMLILFVGLRGPVECLGNS